MSPEYQLDSLFNNFVNINGIKRIEYYPPCRIDEEIYLIVWDPLKKPISSALNLKTYLEGLSIEPSRLTFAIDKNHNGPAGHAYIKTNKNFNVSSILVDHQFQSYLAPCFQKSSNRYLYTRYPPSKTSFQQQPITDLVNQWQFVKDDTVVKNLSASSQITNFVDRAKERRDLYGDPEIPLELFKAPKKIVPKPMKVVKIAPVKQIETQYERKSLGYKLLKSMGWREGRGLGPREDGITRPIKLDKKTNHQCGLGLDSIEDHFHEKSD